MIKPFIAGQNQQMAKRSRYILHGLVFSVLIISVARTQTCAPYHYGQNSQTSPISTGSVHFCRRSLLNQIDRGDNQEGSPYIRENKHIPFEGDNIRRIQYNEAVEVKYFKRNHNVRWVTCSALFRGDRTEMMKATILMNNTKPARIRLEYYIGLRDRRRCAAFIQHRGYIMDVLTDEEKDFPLAFGILVHKEVELVERLLRAIYRPQNFYCIHIDAKMHKKERAALEGVIGCFPNIFSSSRSISVVWGSPQILEADRICMEDLWRHPEWKYFINLAGQEFPLRTNYELVKILQAMDGANFVQSNFRR